MDKIKYAFRQGFLKKAYDNGFTEEQAVELYKSAFNDLPISSTDAADFKDDLRGQGVQPVLSGNDQDYAARHYNSKLIEERDRLGRQDPVFAAAGGGITGGAIGAALGTGAGHMAGTQTAKMTNPALMSREALTKMPGRFRIGGALLGALAGGIPNAMHQHHRVEVAQKLQDPRNLDAMVKQLAAERHLANNQF